MFFSHFTFRVHCCFLCCLMVATSCFAQEGDWDASLECPGGSIRFGLKIEKNDGGEWNASIVNGDESIPVPEVTIAGATILLNIDHYESQLELKLHSEKQTPEKLSGIWKKRRGPNKWLKMKVSAMHPPVASSSNFRPTDAFDGRWKVKFSSSDEPAVGIFKLKEETLLGTFLTTTGDYRFLAGSAYVKDMELSCFDGAHAFLFKAKLNDDGSLSGDFWSSKHWHETWTAVRDDAAKLPDSFEQTRATSKNINALTFPDLDGKDTKLDDDRFLAPVRIVHIFGSWCPNCHDAGAYLAELKENYGDEISIVGIAFELTGDFERDAKQVRKYLKRHELDHPVLIGGGSSSKEKASETITFIDEVRSYPTTVFANRDGKIIAVHQGFSGAATGDAYEELKRNFEKVIAKTKSSNR